MSNEQSSQQREDLVIAPSETTAAVGIADRSDGSSPSKSEGFCHFSCKRCFKLAQDPVLNAICGHLFCWDCLYNWTKSEEGPPNGCPFCSSHLCISETGLTVFPVYSGSSEQPIIIPHGDDLDEPAPTEETHTEGKHCTPPRRPWYSKRRYASQSDCIVSLIMAFKTTRSNFKFNMYHLFASFPPAQTEIAYTERRMIRLIKDLEGGWRWLTGKDYTGKQSRETGELLEDEGEREQQNSKAVLLPTTNDFPIQLSYFSCGICKDIAFEPVVTVCGHLFCWTCLFHQTTTDDSPGCHICDRYVNIYSSRNDINPIYCYKNDPICENKFLKCRRKNENGKLLPPRLLPTAAVTFLDYMIDKVVKLKDAIMTTLNGLRHNQDSNDGTEDKSSWMENEWDILFKDLLIEWRDVSGEHIPERLISPTFLDFECQHPVATEINGRIIYNMTRTIVDITTT